MAKKFLIYRVFVNLIFDKLPISLFFPLIVILLSIYKKKSVKNKKLNKRHCTLELIEAIIIAYNKKLIKRNERQILILNFQEKIDKRLKIFLINDDLQLYLLRNLLYRILNKCITQSNIRKLVKIEVLKAPEGTFSDFVYLFDELKKELKFGS